MVGNEVHMGYGADGTRELTFLYRFLSLLRARTMFLVPLVS